MLKLTIIDFILILIKVYVGLYCIYGVLLNIKKFIKEVEFLIN